jgi:hypothetical protein
MKTITELQAAREEENKASNFEGFDARALNEASQILIEAGEQPNEFPISGDAELRAQYHQLSQ